MVRTGSLFNQILAQVPREAFARLVANHGAEQGAKGFSCWSQFVAMLFCHLGHAQSLREICDGLASFSGKLNHLGVDAPPKRSTLAYANARRPAALYEELFYTLLERFRAKQMLGLPARRAFRFKNRLLSLDSTTISLCLSLFPWSDYRHAKGGVKAHVLLDHADLMPSFVQITSARVADTMVARKLVLQRGSIVVMDCAYCDSALFELFHNQGVYFVTRLHPNIHYEVLKELPLPPGQDHLRKVQQIRLSGARSQKYQHPLLYVEVWDPRKKATLCIITNHLRLSAATVAEVYRDRWQIEIFFKTLKQQLRIKTFVGTSENALRIQLWTALIALLILRWLHHLSSARWSLSNLAAILRFNLFNYRQLSEWLHTPFGPAPPKEEQLALSWTADPLPST